MYEGGRKLSWRVTSSILSETGQSSAVITHSLTSTPAAMCCTPSASPPLGGWTRRFALLHVVRVLSWQLIPAIFCGAVLRRNQKVKQALWAESMAVNQPAVWLKTQIYGLDQFRGGGRCFTPFRLL